MNTETVVKLVEEMVDLKVQHFAESMMKPTPEVARLPGMIIDVVFDVEVHAVTARIVKQMLRVNGLSEDIV